MLGCFVFGRPSNPFSSGYDFKNAFTGKFMRWIRYTGCGGFKGLFPSTTPFGKRRF